jgi:hypothetical protein
MILEKGSLILPDQVLGHRGLRHFDARLQRLRDRFKLRRNPASRKTMNAGIFGLVDDTHTATAKLLNDLVMRDDLANHGRKQSCWRTS